MSEKVIDARAGDRAHAQLREWGYEVRGEATRPTHGVTYGVSSCDAMPNGTAHELDNIAVECGLGHSPKPGDVAAYVRELREAVRVLGTEVEAWRNKDKAMWNEENGNDPTGLAEAAYSVGRAISATDNNPLARASVEKAGEHV